jgi:hypothetical protein
LTEGTRIASQITVQYLTHLVQLQSKINNHIISDADPNGRAVQGVGCSLAKIAGSNPAGVMNIFLVRVLCVVR